MAGQPASRGRLVLNVAEASGRTDEDQVVWDQSFVEGFVKVEVRGEGRTVKVVSRPRRIISHSINWNEDLAMDVLEGAKELRLMLCREKRSDTRTSTSVVAACGIFIEDIINAVPIDKYFELFKPGAAGPGGFIRISMNFEPASSTPYHSPEDHRSAHSAMSDSSYQDLSIGEGHSGRTTPRDLEDDTPARRLTEDGFTAGQESENGDVPEHTLPLPATGGTDEMPEMQLDPQGQPIKEPAGQGPAKHGVQWIIAAGLIAAAAYAFKTLSDRQQNVKK